MKVLALETANEQCSVALIDQHQELFFQLDDRAKAQTQTIFPMIEAALRDTRTEQQLHLVEAQDHLVVYRSMPL